MLREASVDELAELVTLHPGFDRTAILTRFAWLPTVDAAWYVWWVDSAPRGWAVINWQGKLTAPDFPNLSDLFVHPQWRGQGIGTSILTMCEQIVSARGYTRLGLAVNPDLNPRALTLYQRLGYAATSQEKYLDDIYDGVEDWVIDLEKIL
jgi:GNAT superfamily N-acetyltransferase